VNAFRIAASSDTPETYRAHQQRRSSERNPSPSSPSEPATSSGFSNLLRRASAPAGQAESPVTSNPVPKPQDKNATAPGSPTQPDAPPWKQTALLSAFAITPSAAPTEQRDAAAAEANDSANSKIPEHGAPGNGAAPAHPDRKDPERSSENTPDGEQLATAATNLAAMPLAQGQEMSAGDSVVLTHITPEKGRTASALDAPDADVASSINNGASQGPSGELAFALRVDTGHSSMPIATTGADRSVSFGRAAAGIVAATPAPARDHSLSQDQANAGGENGGTSAGNTGADEAKAAASAHAEHGASSTEFTRFEAELEKFRSEPVRSVHVQLENGDAQRVDIRMTERAGQLAVSVRSADPALAHSLQERTAELSSSLEAGRYRAEIWSPGQNSGGSRQDQPNTANPGGGREHGQPPRQQQGKSQQQTPDWVKRLEESSRASQNRIEYKWQQ
jgi:hypothetical protein